MHKLDRVVRAALTAAVSMISLLAMSPMAAQAAASDFTVYDGTTTSPILIDQSYGGEHDDRDYRQVRRAVQDLRQDVAMVTGAVDEGEVQRLFVDDEAAKEARLGGADQSKVPALITDAGDEATAIIVGVIGESALVDGIIDAGKFDEAAAIEGEWEAYAIKQVDEPVPGVDNALVIAGSDARGTIYGIYSLSEEIGVSPWYWYSDVPVEQQDEILVDGSVLVDDGPDVKYRGIFLNDEERTIDWAKLKFPTDKGTPEVNYYRHVYETMLRLKMNTLWPAMHEGTTSFNAATDTGMYDAGTPINAQEAAEYGVIMSSSHAELMLRSNVEEWRPFYERNKEVLDIQGSNYTAAFNYSINKHAIIQYWRERLVANQEFESIVALGLRGVHDGAPAFTPGNPYGFGNVVEMVGDAVTEQRELIEEVYGSVDAVPQVFIPYKEMADLYNSGLKDYIPGDVTLMWAEDNAGYLRQVPTQTEAARSGGNGIYYHNSYWGSPKSYLWLNSVSTALMVEQLHRAWNSDARRYWILNVGDIKPGEMKTELFAKLAWDVDGYDDTNISSRFLVEQVERDFGLTGDEAATVVDALDRFSTLESTKRAEYWGTQNPSGVHSAGFNGSYSFPFSATADGDELQRYINEANELVEILEGVSDGLDERYRSAFYQQVLHSVRSYRNQAEQIGYYWKNQLSAQQGRYGSAKVYAELSKRARERIRSDEEYWDTVSGGKWDEAIGYSHPITYYGGVNEGIVMLTDDRYAAVASPADGVGANAEGQKVPGSGTLRFNSASPDDERFFDVFARNVVAEEWVAETDAPWISLSASAGTTSTEQRVTLTVDWSQLEASATGTIRVYNAADGEKTSDPVATFTVQADESAVDLGGTLGHIEANGYVAIEAEHFAENVTGADGSRWHPVKGNAQRGDTMKAVPETAARVDANFTTTAGLRYRVYFTTSGQFTGTFYRVPTLNEGTEDDGTTRSSRTAIGLDGNVPASANLRGCAGTGCGSAWASNVMRQIEPLVFTIDVPTPGWHDVVVYRSDASIVFDRIVIETVAGAVGDGLVGPVESPNTIAKGDAVEAATVAPLPEAVAAYRPLPPVSLSVGETRTVEDVEDVVAVESDNDTAVSVALDGGEMTITGRRVGMAEITISSGDGASSSFTVTVERGDGPQLGAYLEEDGLVVIDAADALERSAFADAIASNNGMHTWTLTRNGVQVVPVANSSAKANWLATSATQAEALLTATPTQTVNGSAAGGTPPRLEFTVDIENGGTYYLFVNSSNPNADADSYHVAVDGQWRYHSSKGAQETAVETWYGSTSVNGAALTLAPGRHTVSLWAREAGFHVNQVVLTTNSSPAFAGFQAASERERLNDAPVIDSVTADPDTGEAPLEVAFSVAASDPDDDELTYEWDFGDGSTSNEQNPAHTYETPGTYRATVTVSDGTDEASASVTVEVREASDETPPETTAALDPANPGAGGTYDGPVEVTLSATDPASGVAFTEYRVNTDGETGDWVRSDSDGGEDPFDTSFTVSAPGSHTIDYRSTDGAGNVEADKSVAFSIEDDGTGNPGAPTVQAFADPASGPAPLRVRFSATGLDPDGGELRYRWDFENGAVLRPNAVYTFTEPGVHEATVTVTDDEDDTASETIQVTVTDPAENVPPTVEASVDEPMGQAPHRVRFDATGIDPDGRNAELVYHWEFGDGGESFARRPGHTYREPGVYTATVTVTDPHGGSGTAEVDVEVTNPPGNRAPTVEAAALPQSGMAPLSTLLSAQGSDPDGDRLTYSWEFGDGQSGEGRVVRHAYLLGGAYTATVTATDTHGESATAEVEVVVGNPAGNQAPSVQVAADPATGNAPLLVRFSSAASDPDGDQLMYVWEFGDGGMAGGPRVAHRYASVGTYTAKLTVTDPHGATASQTITVVVSAAQQAGNGRTGAGADEGDVAGESAGTFASIRRPKSIAAFRRRGLRVTLTCSDRIHGKATLRVSRRAARRLGLDRRILAARKVACDDGDTVRLRLKPRREVRRQLATASTRRLRLTLRVAVKGDRDLERRVTIRTRR